MQTRTTTWDQHVDVFVHAQHFVHQRTIRAFNRLNGTCWQTALFQRLLNHFDGGGVGAPCLFPPAQNGSVAGFQAQRGDVNGDVWTRFINNANHAKRHAATFKTQAAVEQPTVDHLPNRIGKVTHLTHVIGDAFQARRVQRQTIQHCFAQAVSAGFG
ncbi:hypothetical protein D3C78_1473250 [compost metagenome]